MALHVARAERRKREREDPLNGRTVFVGVARGTRRNVAVVHTVAAGSADRIAGADAPRAAHTRSPPKTAERKHSDGQQQIGETRARTLERNRGSKADRRIAPRRPTPLPLSRHKIHARRGRGDELPRTCMPAFLRSSCSGSAIQLRNVDTSFACHFEWFRAGWRREVGRAACQWRPRRRERPRVQRPRRSDRIQRARAKPTERARVRASSANQKLQIGRRQAITQTGRRRRRRVTHVPSARRSRACRPGTRPGRP